MSTESIKLYGTTWCSDCRRARKVFELQQVDYQYINIEEDAAAAEYVERVNRGNRSVPTIVFPDGSILVEPSSQALQAKLAER